MATLFKPHEATGPPPTSAFVMETYRQAYAKRVADGSLRPLLILYHFYGYLILIAYLCIPHTKRPWLYAARWPVLAAILAFQWKSLHEATSMSMAFGFATGLISIWGGVWSITWLVLMKPQFEQKRVQGRPKKAEEAQNEGLHANGHINGHTNGSTATNGSAKSSKGGDAVLRNRREARDARKGNGQETEDSQVVIAPRQSTLKPTSLDYEPGMDASMEYYWQAYPEKLSERIPWVLDLIINFRMPGWNCQIPPLPALPPSMKQALGEPVDAASRTGVSSVGLQRYDTRRALLKARLPWFIAGYFALDILKVVMMNDPYFIVGPTTYDLPWYLRDRSPHALQFIRQSISSYSIIISLEMVFLMCPLGMSILLGPRVLGLQGQAFYYATTWGSWSNVTHKGLNGLWGGWWHQTFRFAFSAPSNYLIKNGYVKAHTTLARMTALFYAFAISGVIHAGGSITQFPRTYWWHCPAFFMLQAVGILIQSTSCALLHPLIKKLPKPIRRWGNFFYVFFWLLFTGHWLTDDFATGGIWLYEPIPFSPLRGLGFGEPDAKFYCWDHIGVGWYTGKHWWESGIAL